MNDLVLQLLLLLGSLFIAFLIPSTPGIRAFAFSSVYILSLAFVLIMKVLNQDECALQFEKQTLRQKVCSLIREFFLQGGTASDVPEPNNIEIEQFPFENRLKALIPDFQAHKLHEVIRAAYKNNEEFIFMLKRVKGRIKVLIAENGKQIQPEYFTNQKSFELSIKNTKLFDYIEFFNERDIELKNVQYRNTALFILSFSKVKINIEASNFSTIYVFAPNCEFVNISNCKDLKKLSFHHCYELETLACTENKIHVLKLETMPRLVNLYCEYNRLQKLDLGGLKGLKICKAEHNQLEELAVPLTVKNLNVARNQLKSLSVSRNNNIIELSAEFNMIEKFQACKCRNLRLVNLYCNRIQSFNIVGDSKLEKLNIGMNEIQALDLTDFTKLEWVSAWKNSIEQVDLRNCIALRYLKIHDNLLQQINIRDCQADIEVLGDEFAQLLTKNGILKKE